MKYGVIGGKGFVGSAFTAELHERGHEVMVIDVDEYNEAVGSTFDVLINANGNSRKYLARREPAREFDLSVGSVSRSLQDFKTTLYVHLSTIDVYANPSDPAHNHEQITIDPTALSPYGFHKYLAEELVQYYADSWLIFRMAGFVGPGLWKNSIYDLLQKQSLYVHPDSEYQYLHTRDLAGIVLDVIEANVTGEIFNIAGDGVISLRQIAAWLPDALPEKPGDDTVQERYEVNISKIKKYHTPPRTTDTVRAFIKVVTDGKETLT